MKDIQHKVDTENTMGIQYTVDIQKRGCTVHCGNIRGSGNERAGQGRQGQADITRMGSLAG